MSDKHSTRTAHVRIIKPWEFWVVFFMLFAIGVLWGVYAEQTENDLLFLTAVFGTSALLTAYTAIVPRWVMKE